MSYFIPYTTFTYNSANINKKKLPVITTRNLLTLNLIPWKTVQRYNLSAFSPNFHNQKRLLLTLFNQHRPIDIIIERILTTKTLKVIVKLRISAIAFNKPREVFTSKRKHTQKNRQLVKMTLSIRIWHTTITYNHIPIPIRTKKKKTPVNVRVSKESTYFNAKGRFY